MDLDNLSEKQKLMGAGLLVAVALGLYYMHKNSTTAATTSAADGSTDSINGGLGGFSVGGTLYIPTTQETIDNNYGTQTTDTTNYTGGSTVSTNTPGATSTQPTGTATAVTTAATQKTYTVKNPQGQTFTTDNYNTSVNEAGGQWLQVDNKSEWFAGDYNTQGIFDTLNASQQAAYNKAAKVS